jgi:inosine-uridine nucleoside N-ribohydrolase
MRDSWDGVPDHLSFQTKEARMRVLLDVDTGTDDAVAIMLAALHPGLELAAVTTVSGNVPVANATENSLRVLEYIGRTSIPVYAGAAEPLARPARPGAPGHRNASRIHGDYLDLPPATGAPVDGIAALAILAEFRDTGETVLVATGPLTNVALALKLDPGLARRIRTLVIMGGSHAIANVTPSAEFNIWADPEAARTVLGSGIEKIVLVTLDATHRALLSWADCQRFRALGTPAGEAAARFIERRIAADGPPEPGSAAPVHDALCVAYLVDPSVVSLGRYAVDVETSGELTVGRTVIDTQHRSGREPAVWVALDGDAQKFRDLLLATFAAR